MTTALVTGSHVRGNAQFVFARLDALRADLGFDFLVTGGADFIDTYAMLWCIDRKVSFAVEYAQWKRHGGFAGPLRNQRMLDKYKPSFVIAFYGDKGTRDMMARSRAAGVTVYEQLPN